MSRIYYRGTRAALVCYDTSNLASFAKARFWINELTATAPDAAIYIIGCKGEVNSCPQCFKLLTVKYSGPRGAGGN